MSSSDNGSGFLETGECDRLCESFREITATNVKSVSDNFKPDQDKDVSEKEKTKFKEHMVLEKDDSVEGATGNFCDESKKRREVAHSSIGKPPSFDANVLKCIIWNIEGLSEKNADIRMQAIAKIILEHDADIVFLQEVVPSFAEYFIQTLCTYECIFGDDEDYFNGTLMKKSKFQMKQWKVVFYDNTRMGRHYVEVKGQFGSIPICLINTHLESMRDFSDCRKEQLKLVFDKILNMPCKMTVIFGGDMNIRDKELSDIGGIPNGIQDVWAACGSRKEVSYTWDMSRNDNLGHFGKSKPCHRFDRIYFRSSYPERLKPVLFDLVGLERLSPHRCFPSDHWGMLSHYQVLEGK